MWNVLHCFNWTVVGQLPVDAVPTLCWKRIFVDVLPVLCRLIALHATQPTVSKHWRELKASHWKLAFSFLDSRPFSWQRFLVTVSPMSCLFWTDHFNTVTLLFAGYVTLIMALCYRGLKMKLTVFPAATDSRFLREVSRLFLWLIVSWLILFSSYSRLCWIPV